MPIALGPGLPARASWACMYCFSNVLTVSQSSFSSSAMSLIVACRQRWPDVMGKALRIERVVRQEIEPLALHLAATAASHPPDLNLQEDAVSPHGRSRTCRIRRSYQPECICPQHPQTVFLRAGRA